MVKTMSTQSRSFLIIIIIVAGFVLCGGTLLLYRWWSTQHGAVSATHMTYIINKHPPEVPLIKRQHLNQVHINKKIEPNVDLSFFQYNNRNAPVKVLVRLRDSSLMGMNVNDLYTFRLWLFTKEGRLLNRKPLPITSAFDKDGQFQPYKAIASLRQDQVEAEFEVEPNLWLSTHSLLITGGIMRGTSQSLDFECLVEKSRAKRLAAPPHIVRSRFPVFPKHLRNECRWRWWIIHQPSQRSWNSGWQKGAWLYDQIVGLDVRHQTLLSGWSQILLWHESDWLREESHTITLSPLGGIEWFLETTDRKARFLLAYSVVIESLASKGVYQLIHKADGFTHGISATSISFPYNPDDYLRPLSQPPRVSMLRSRSPIDSGVPKGWEAILFGDTFHSSGNGYEFLFNPSERKELEFKSSFCLLRIQSHLLIQAEINPGTNRLEPNRFGATFCEPFFNLFAEAYHGAERCSVNIDF